MSLQIAFLQLASLKSLSALLNNSMYLEMLLVTSPVSLASEVSIALPSIHVKLMNCEIEAFPLINPLVFPFLCAGEAFFKR